MSSPKVSIPFCRNLDALVGLRHARDHFPTGRPATRAALCSEIARLAYVEDKAYMAKALGKVGINKLWSVEVEGADAFIMEDDRHTYLAFRGTEARDPRDIMRDMKTWPIDWRGKGRVHKGFAGGFDGLWPQIEAELKTRKKPLIITGHSLGGAYATLASIMLPDAVETATFGAPRVGCESFNRHVNDRKLKRYVGCSDVVCRLPPRGAFPYKHAGTMIYIDRYGIVHDRISRIDIALDRLKAQADFARSYRKPTKHTPSRILADHAPINYSTALLGIRTPPEPGKSRIPMDRRRPVVMPDQPAKPPLAP